MKAYSSLRLSRYYDRMLTETRHLRPMIYRPKGDLVTENFLYVIVKEKSMYVPRQARKARKNTAFMVMCMSVCVNINKLLMV